MTDKLKLTLGSLGGIGFLPYGPGTWGSLASLVILYPVALYFGSFGLYTAIITGSALTVWAAEAAVKRWGEDPGCFVIDEFAGQAVALLYLPFTGDWKTDLPLLASAFLLFRFFDIAKPLGINRIQHLPSGIGILADDIIAGFYALFSIHIGIFILSVL